ncbi:MAG: hypothetical protein GVY13_17050 [Alphaproteobacteria bacterium]|jgi:hypothetical protein|nr:hypothetical protein [Alphaproteobacteria bacterium]
MSLPRTAAPAASALLLLRPGTVLGETAGTPAGDALLDPATVWGALATLVIAALAGLAVRFGRRYGLALNVAGVSRRLRRALRALLGSDRPPA